MIIEKNTSKGSQLMVGLIQSSKHFHKYMYSILKLLNVMTNIVCVLIGHLIGIEQIHVTMFVHVCIN